MTTNNRPAGKDKKTRPRRQRWLKEGVIAITLLTLFSVGIDLSRSQNMPSDTLPELIATTTQNEQIDLMAMSQKKPVILYFWATWCAACKFVTPTVNWMSGSNQVVSVAIRSGSDKRINAYLNKHGYNFPAINDEKGTISQAWGIMATPTVVIVKDGQVKSVTTGISTPPGLWLRLLFAG